MIVRAPQPEDDVNLVQLTKEELELTFAGYLIDEIGPDGWAKLMGGDDRVTDLVNLSVAGEPPPPPPVINARGYPVSDAACRDRPA